MKFLVDECLSPDLVKLAHDRGHGESSHVVWRRLQGKKDWELKPFILDGDWTRRFATACTKVPSRSVGGLSP
jgi:hypothetical protein